MSDEKPTDMYDILDAIEAVLAAADPAKCDALAKTIDAYAEDFPEDFFWAIGDRRPHSCITCLARSMGGVGLLPDPSRGQSSALWTGSPRETPRGP